ncbi:MAG: O-antigen/teichoic acid export membrane protein [Limisphaerales bacterium]|jgi:O-antigen/teichoic acid export membrane protein
MAGSHTDGGKSEKSPLKALLSQTLVYGLSTVFVRLLNYVLVPIHTNVFEDQGDYGIISELYAWVTFLNIIFIYGMETAFFRFANKEGNPAKVFGAAFGSLLVSTTLFTTALIIGAGGIANFLALTGHQNFIILFALIIGLDSLSAIPFAWLRHQSKPLTYMGIKLLNVLVNVGLNVYFLLGPTYNPEVGVEYVFIANLVASGVTMLALLPLIIKIRPSFDFALWKKMMVYGSPFILAGLAGMVNETIDRIMLPRILSGSIQENRAQLGIYSAVYKLSIFMTLAVQAFRMGAEPFFFRMAKKGNATEIYALVMRAFVPIACLMFLVVSLWLDYFGLIIGPNYREGLHVVPILLMANLFLGVYYNLSVWYKLTDRTTKAIWLSLTGASLTILLNLWLIPLIGYLGSAWATFIAYFVMAALSWSWGRKYYFVPYPVVKLLSMIGLAALLYLLYIQFEGQLNITLQWFARFAILFIFTSYAWWLDSKKLLKQ